MCVCFSVVVQCSIMYPPTVLHRQIDIFPIIFMSFPVHCECCICHSDHKHKWIMRACILVTMCSLGCPTCTIQHECLSNTWWTDEALWVPSRPLWLQFWETAARCRHWNTLKLKRLLAVLSNPLCSHKNMHILQLIFRMFMFKNIFEINYGWIIYFWNGTVIPISQRSNHQVEDHLFTKSPMCTMLFFFQACSYKYTTAWRWHVLSMFIFPQWNKTEKHCMHQ